MKFNTSKLHNPQMIFILYIFFTSVLIMIFRAIFPGSEAPLTIYASNWRWIQGMLTVFNLFPALALSALVIPFAILSNFISDNQPSFSEIYFKRFTGLVITAICAAVIYAIIFFFAMPLVKNQEEQLRFNGGLFHLARANAIESADSGEWEAAAQFLNIADAIWPNSPGLDGLRDRIHINLRARLFEESGDRALARSALIQGRQDVGMQTGFIQTAGQDEVDAAEAIIMSRVAFNEMRFFDAHWLANLAMRLAPNGSAQEVLAAQLASEAWNMITVQAPSRREEQLFRFHNMKIAGYQAMNAERWIEAFYIFQELLSLTPDDPDVRNFLTISRRNAVQTAFFIDELNLSLGEIINGALFSLPIENGRAVVRFSTLTISPDVAYGIDMEYMEFDANNRLLASVVSRYVKMLPITLNDRQQILVLTHALDRDNEENAVTSVWLYGYAIHPTFFILDISFEDFLLASHIRQGLPNIQIIELFNAAARLGAAGYIPQIFHAEILNRFGIVVFFLPIAIFTIVIAWRYRAKKKPHYLIIPMFFILPVVFHAFVHLYRAVFNTMGIWLILSAGFLPALIIFIVILTALLFISLIVLSAQHE
ncbi:MAG: hypothetical protein FWC97_10515 [Treponema sp.]|nr:hypothetical protein [Treponema sp.]